MHNHGFRRFAWRYASSFADRPSASERRTEVVRLSRASAVAVLLAVAPAAGTRARIARRDRMTLARREFLQLAAGAAVLPTLARDASAQGYPTRPVRLILGFPAGGSTDLVARIMAAWLSERLGQSFVVENKPGAGTNLAAQAAVASPPDGYTLMFVTTTNAINATFHKSLPFDFLRDIAPVAGLVDLPLVMEVGSAVPVKTVAEFIAYAKADPGKVN